MTAPHLHQKPTNHSESQDTFHHQNYHVSHIDFHLRHKLQTSPKSLPRLLQLLLLPYMDFSTELLWTQTNCIPWRRLMSHASHRSQAPTLAQILCSSRI